MARVTGVRTETASGLQTASAHRVNKESPEIRLCRECVEALSNFCAHLIG